MGGRGASFFGGRSGNTNSSGKNVLKVSTANVKNMTTVALYSERT